MSIWLALLPFLIAAIGVERAIELLWNYIDWLILSARNRTAQVKSPSYLQFKSGTSLLLGMILGILIANYTGMRLLSALQPLTTTLFADIPLVWDVVITGVLIGALAKPIHDLLGVMTELKNLLGNSAIKQREAASAALAEGVLKLAQSDAQAMVDVPGIGPARLASSGRMGRVSGEEEENGGNEKSPTEQYIELLRNRTAL
jgi:hypothetical protein